MPDIVAVLRVRDEARWISEVLQALAWCRQVYLFDDNSTDNTVELAEAEGATVIRSPFNDFDEARDKAYLVKEVHKDWAFGTWILMVDGDEVLAEGSQQRIEAAIASRVAPAYRLRIIYLWNSRDQARVDGVYGRFSRPSLFQMNQYFNFKHTDPEGNLHCSSVPSFYLQRTAECTAILFHLGYMDKEDRLRKWEYYNKLDPHNVAEGYDPRYPERGSYPWIVQGDIEAVPAGAHLKHAGPLEVQKI